MILAFEAVSRAGSACVLDADGTHDFIQLQAGQVAARLPAVLHELRERHGRPAELAVAHGPGSFTGLRIAVLAARTLAWLEDLPVRAVDSLAALAAGAGDGLWWTLLPLKRDVTFHALYRVAAGRVRCLAAPSAVADAEPPTLGPDFTGATAIGPALAEKAGLLARWAPGFPQASVQPCDARGVAAAAADSPLLDWRDLHPAYHMASAPALQRDRRDADQAAR